MSNLRNVLKFLLLAGFLIGLIFFGRNGPELQVYTPPPQTQEEVVAVDPLTPESLLLETNEARAKADLPVLKANTRLEASAAAKCQDMVDKDYFSHDGWTRFIPDYPWKGENLAQGYVDSEELTQDWLDSPTHRKNILDPRFTDVGFAICEEPQSRETVNGRTVISPGFTLVVQHFGMVQ